MCAKQLPAMPATDLPGGTQGRIQWMWRYPFVLHTLHATDMTWPCAVTGVDNRSSPDRIQPGLAITGKHVRFILGKTGAEAPFPQGTGTSVRTIDILNVALPKRLDHQAGALRQHRRYQQMGMLGHQATGVDPAARLPRLLTRILRIATVIRLRVETGRPVITSLIDVPGDAWHSQAYTPRHHVPLVQGRQAVTTT